MVDFLSGDGKGLNTMRRIDKIREEKRRKDEEEKERNNSREAT